MCGVCIYFSSKIDNTDIWYVYDFNLFVKVEQIVDKPRDLKFHHRLCWVMTDKSFVHDINRRRHEKKNTVANIVTLISFFEKPFCDRFHQFIDL